MVEAPMVYTTTSTPRCCNFTARLPTNSSVPPYSLGGTGMKGGDIRAIFIVYLERCAEQLRRFHICWNERPCSEVLSYASDRFFEFNGPPLAGVRLKNASLRRITDATHGAIIQLRQIPLHILG